MFDNIYIVSYDCYLYYLSYRINKIKTIKNITYIIKNISFFYRNISSDAIIDILTECLNKYPLCEEKMRAISILRQNYEKTNGIEDYCCFVLWISIIYSINNNNNYKSLL